MVELTEEQIKELVALRDDAIDGFERHKSEFVKLGHGYYSILPEAQIRALKKRNKSILTPNLIMPKVNKVVRDMLQAFFDSDNLVELRPENKESEEDRKVAEALRKELKEYTRDNNIFSKCEPVVKNTLIYGTSITKVYFSTAENTVKMKSCDLDEVFIDPYAASGGDVRYMVHRVSTMTVADMKRQYKNFKVIWDEHVNNSLRGESKYIQNNDIGEYQRVEFYEVYRKKNGKWYVSTLLNDDTVIRYDKLLKDGNPFIIGHLESQTVLLDEVIAPVRAYGASFIAPLLSLQTENTIKRNQQVDAIDTQLNQRFITTSSSGVREDDLNSNRKKIVVNEMGNIRELPIPRLNDSIFGTQQIEAEAQEISGITKISTGMNDKQNLNQTATGMSILTQETGAIVSHMNRAFAESFFRPFIQRVCLLLYKYKDSKRFYEIDRKRPMRQKIIVNVGTGSRNKTIELQNIDNAIMSATQTAQLYMQMQDMERAAKYALMLDDLNTEKLKLLGQDSIIDDVEEMMEQQQQQRAMQEQMMQEQAIQQQGEML